MSEHGDLWPGPRREHGAADEPQPPLEPDTAPLGSGDDAPTLAGAVPDATPAPDVQATPAVGQTPADTAAAFFRSAPGERPEPPIDEAAEADLPAGPQMRSAARSRSTTPPDSERRFAGRRALIWSVVGAVVVVAAAATAYLLLRDDGSEAAPAPVPTVTTTLPAPTATAAPIDRGEGSALFAALPGVVRQYVLTAISPVAPAVPGGPLETYDLTYQGDLDDAAVTYTVHVEQFATPELAAAAAEVWGAPLAPASSTGEVLVGGAATGAYSLFGDDGSAAQSGSAVWTNGTLVLQASGPALDIRNFYLAFGL